MASVILYLVSIKDHDPWSPRCYCRTTPEMLRKALTGTRIYVAGYRRGLYTAYKKTAFIQHFPYSGGFSEAVVANQSSSAVLSRNDPETSKKIQEYAAKPYTPVSLNQMFQFGLQRNGATLLTSAKFLHSELPIRLAKRVEEVDTLPEDLRLQPSVQRIRNWYLKSVMEIASVPEPQTQQEAALFTDICKRVKNRHNDVVPTMARGIAEWKLTSGKELGPDITGFLDRFYSSRIGVRLLLGQHISLLEQSNNEEIVGLIEKHCSPSRVARDASDDARELAMSIYGLAPEVIILGDLRLTFTYVPSHLYHIFFELLKNALRATIEYWKDDVEDEDQLPPVTVVIAGSNMEDVSIRISDQGGGMSRADAVKVWAYDYTSATAEASLYLDGNVQVLAGFGYGLPLSKLYAEYFGGELKLISLQGFGSDSFVFLKRLAHSPELLPG